MLLMVVVPIFLLDNGESQYFRYGWHDDFVLVSVPINNKYRYIGAVFFVVITRVGEVFIGEIANPVIGFNIYNPDKKIITEFTKKTNFSFMETYCIPLIQRDRDTYSKSWCW